MTRAPVGRPIGRPAGQPADRQAGFTLIELLVVVVIIGILIAIAVPLYLNYRKGANDKAAQSDLRGAVGVFEQCFSDNGGYPSAVTSAGSATCGTATSTVKLSSNTSLTYYPKSLTDLTAYIATTTSSAGGGKVYCYSSATGGSVTTIPTSSAAVTAYRAAC